MNEEQIQKVVRAVVAALGHAESKAGAGEGSAVDEEPCCSPRAVVRVKPRKSKGARCVCICGDDEEAQA